MREACGVAGFPQRVKDGLLFWQFDFVLFRVMVAGVEAGSGNAAFVGDELGEPFFVFAVRCSVVGDVRGKVFVP